MKKVSKPFSLLRLPVMVIRKVFRFLDPFETVEMFLAYRRPKFFHLVVLKPEFLFIRFGRGYNGLIKLRVTDNKDWRFFMEKRAINDPKRKKNDKKKKKKRKNENPKGKAKTTTKKPPTGIDSRELRKKRHNQMNTFWDQPFRGTIKWAELLVDLYQYSAISVEFIGLRTELPSFMWDWLTKERPVRICVMRNCNRRCLKQSDIDLLKRFGPRDGILLYSLTVEVGSEFDITMTTTRFITENAAWMRMHHIFSLDTVIIQLWKAGFQNSDLTVFVRHWLNGGNRRLRALFVEENSVELADDPLSILEGLECNYELFSERKGYSVIFNIPERPRYIDMENGVDVHRSDGRRLSISRKNANEYWFLDTTPIQRRTPRFR